MEFLFGILMLSLMVGIVVAIIWANKKRREEMAAIAEELHLKFYPNGDSTISPLLSQLEFFAIGRSHRVHNLITGTIQHSKHNLTVAIFDYYYTVGHSKNRDTVGQTVLLIYDESLRLPSFTLRPELWFDKLSNLVGFEDINFTEFPTFSKRYRLSGKSEAMVRSLFQPNLLKFYENQKLCTEAQGSVVAIFASDGQSAKARNIYIQRSKVSVEGRLIYPNEVKTFLNNGLHLIDLLRHNSR